MGSASRQAIREVLSKHYSQVGETLVNNLSDLRALIKSKPDLVFLGVKKIPADSNLDFLGSNKIWLSDYLDQYGILYTGSSQKAHNLEHNKHLAKQKVIKLGLDTSPFYVARQNNTHLLSELLLKYPLFVKPTNRGGSLGIDDSSLVHNLKELKFRVQKISEKYNSDSLIEEYLPGNEFSVSILKNENSSSYLIMPIEIISPVNKKGSSILSRQIKHQDTEQSLEMPEGSLKNGVMNLAIRVFHALGASDYGRIDIRLDKFGIPQFLEANLIPSLANKPGNYFPKACLLNQNLDYEAMILRIVKLAFSRQSKSFENDYERDIRNNIPYLAIDSAL